MKRILSVLLLCAVLVTCFVPSVFAQAAEVSEVLADLRSMSFDGKPFNTLDYPRNVQDKQVHLIALSEQGYSKDGDQKDYALYLYFYNPSGQAFEFDSVKNKIQMGIAWNSKNETVKSDKFRLQFVGASDDAGFENVYLKYRLVDKRSTYDAKTMAERQGTTRIYNLSSVELLPRGSINAKDYTLGDSYVIKGFDVGYGAEGKSSKKVTAERSYVLELEVNHTYWRSQSSAKGVNYKQQLNAVYFSVPNNVLAKYGELEAIAAEWYQYETTPIIVTDDQTLYDALLPYRGVTIDPETSDLNYGLCYGKKDYASSSGAVIEWDWAYNLEDDPWWFASPTRYKESLNNLGWLMKAEEKITLASTSNISSAEMIAYLNANLNKYPLLKDYDPENMDSHYVNKVIHFDDEFEFKNYKEDRSWLEVWLAYAPAGGWSLFGGYTVDVNETYPDMLPIEIVDRPIYKTTAQIMEIYHIHEESDAKAFQKYVNTAVANDESVIMLRYLQSDYHSEALTVKALGDSPEIEGSAYVAWQTAVLDFDIIELYCSEGTIVASCDPTNFVAGTDAPSVAPGNLIPKAPQDWWWLFWLVLTILLTIVGFVYIRKIVFKKSKKRYRSQSNYAISSPRRRKRGKSRYPYRTR